MTAPLPLAVTMGEPAGIGGELSLKAWLARKSATRPFCVLDDPARLATLARDLGLKVPIKDIMEPAEADAVFATALPVMPVRLRTQARAGRPDPANAPATLEAIERAAGLAKAGKIAGFATNPIQKKTLQEAGAIFGDNLSPQKARILLMLALQTSSNAQEIQRLFDK